MVGGPAERVLRYFEGDEAQFAVEALRAYYSPRRCYTGARFDEMAAVSHPSRYTAEDFLAVSTLSVAIPAASALALVDDGRAVPSPAVVPPMIALRDAPQLLDANGVCRAWWDRVRGLPGLGRTMTSKLLAVKRPHLVPIYDTHVAQALYVGGYENSHWAFWQEVANSQAAERLWGAVEETRRSAGVPGVSLVRVIDVVVWMRQHGASRHPEGCKECKLDGVLRAGLALI